MRCLFVNWNIHDPFAVAVHIENSLMYMAKPFITQGVYRLQYKCPHPATGVTLAAIVDWSTLYPMALGLNVYKLSGHNCVCANFCDSNPQLNFM